MQLSKPRIDCPVDATMSVIEGRWKTVILCNIAMKGPLRFGQLRDSIPRISSRILSIQLKELEADRMVSKRDSDDGSKVYALTSRGESICPILRAMGEWGLRNMFPNTVLFDDGTILPTASELSQ